jgi:hypothetical protein
VFDTSAHEELQLRLLEVFESQVAGGKRYDLAAMGRRRANATYLEPHQVDAATGAVYADDMTPLIRGDATDALEYAREVMREFTGDVESRVRRLY